MATAVHTDDAPSASSNSNGRPTTGSLPFAFDDFPLLPHGALLWSDSAGNVADLAELVPRLPDCLITLTSTSRNGAALIVGGAVVDAVWADRSRGLVGAAAFTALAKSRVGTVSGFSIEDHRLVQAIPSLWRCPRALTGLPADWLDADKLIRSIRADGRSCALLIEDPVRGAALFADGELVASYTEKRRRPSGTMATLRALLRTPGTRLTVVSPTELPSDSALATLVASVTGDESAAAESGPAAAAEAPPPAADPAATAPVAAAEGDGEAEPPPAPPGTDAAHTWSIRAAEVVDTADAAAETAPPAAADETDAVAAPVVSPTDLTDDDDLDAVVGERILQRFPADAVAPSAEQPPRDEAASAPAAFILETAAGDHALLGAVEEAASLDPEEPFTLTSEQSAAMAVPDEDELWEPASLPAVQEEELSFAAPLPPVPDEELSFAAPPPSAPPAVADDVFTFAPITFPDPTEAARPHIPTFDDMPVATAPELTAFDGEQAAEAVSAPPAAPEVDTPVEAPVEPPEAEPDTELDQEAGSEAEDATLEPAAEPAADLPWIAEAAEPPGAPIGVVVDALDESDPLDDEDFVPTRLDIDIDGLRGELIDIATVWLGVDDIAPVARLIGRARPGVDEFVNAIAAVGALHIPGHETAVVRAMAREMHFRAAEVLCGV